MRVAALLAVSALGCSASSPRLDRHEQALSMGVVISAVYGGSIASASYTKDFVELSGASFSASWALALAFIVRRRRLAREVRSARGAAGR